MISRPPKMEIQQSMLRSYHAFANSHLLISVTFSTPTGDSSSELVVSAIEIFQQLPQRNAATARIFQCVVFYSLQVEEITCSTGKTAECCAHIVAYGSPLSSSIIGYA